MSDEDEDSDFSSEDPAINVSFEDPRTISQIKRSRIDLSRRYVFLCPSYLSKHFDVLPYQAKDSALLVFRCSRNWVFQDDRKVRAARTKSQVACWSVPRTRQTRVPQKSGINALYHSEFSKEFLQWVLTKEKEGCVFWFKPERDLTKLSAFFEEKIDPMNEQPYRPLLLDPQWWRVRFMPSSAKFCLSPNVVVACLSHAATGDSTRKELIDMDIPVLQELIYQSNPTLEPIARWPHAPSMRYVPRPSNVAAHRQVFRGYIDQERRLAPEQGVKFSGQENGRIEKWPGAPKERFDDLQHSWHVQDMRQSRRNHIDTLPPVRFAKTR